MALSNIEVDQSGKIEDSRDSILAYANDKRYAIRVPLHVKQQTLAWLRDQGRFTLGQVMTVLRGKNK